MKEQYCGWCGSVLLENGRCPVEECVQNVLLDELAKAESEAEEKHNTEDTNNDSNQTV